MKDRLQDEVCRECQKAIRVAPTSPYEGDEKVSGCAASAWDGDRQYFIGWICLDCAYAMAMRTKDEPGKRGSLGYGEGEYDFCYG